MVVGVVSDVEIIVNKGFFVIFFYERFFFLFVFLDFVEGGYVFCYILFIKKDIVVLLKLDLIFIYMVLVCRLFVFV